MGIGVTTTGRKNSNAQSTARKPGTQNTQSNPTNEQTSSTVVGRDNQQIAVYSGYMDVRVEALDSSVTLEGLLGDSSLKITDSDATRKLIALKQVQNGLDVRHEGLVTVRKGIRNKTEEVKIATAAYQYSSAVSQMNDAGNNAEFQEEVAQLNRKIRTNRLQIKKGDVAETGNKAAKAKSLQDLYENIVDVDFV